MKAYWEKVWQAENPEELAGYLNSYKNWENDIVKLFHEHQVMTVCDAGCGFGAYSLMMASNGFEVSGFDISEKSVALTKQLLQAHGMEDYECKVSDLCCIQYADDSFDAVVAHAVIDHLNKEDASLAMQELTRIVKKGGFVYLSFDAMEEEDELLSHNVLWDGSFLYTEGDREGLLFRYYTDEMIRNEIGTAGEILYFNTDGGGDRHLVLRV